MPEWLTGTFKSDVSVTATDAAVRLSCALALGCIVALVYRVTHGGSGGSSRQMMSTLVLLSVLIAMMTLVIGDNVARAFSLVGALAIVRFRTVVEDTRDVAFVIFAVGVGMAIGAGFLQVPLIAIPVASLAALVFRPIPTAGAPATPVAGADEFRLTIRTGLGSAGAEPIRLLLERLEARPVFVATRTARQGAAIETTHAVRLRSEADAASLLNELHRIEGVQGVEVVRV